jgi:hypothetical protein
MPEPFRYRFSRRNRNNRSLRKWPADAGSGGIAGRGVAWPPQLRRLGPTLLVLANALGASPGLPLVENPRFAVEDPASAGFSRPLARHRGSAREKPGKSF